MPNDDRLYDQLRRALMSALHEEPNPDAQRGRGATLRAVRAVMNVSAPDVNGCKRPCGSEEPDRTSDPD
jgi:hypothetical protein